MFRKIFDTRILGSKFISTSAARCTAEAIGVTKREEYYKNLATQDADYKPAGWDEALPFEAIPGPKPLPVIGNMWRFLPYIGEYYNAPTDTLYKSLQKKYGDIVVLRGIIGRKPTVIVFNPDDMETFLRNSGPYPVRNGLDSFIYYRTKLRKNVFQGVGGILTVQGEDWYKIRTIVNPILMQPRMVQQYTGSMDKVASDFIENIRYFSTQNKNNEMPDNFLLEIYKFALESIAVVALDKRLGCLNRDLDKNSDTSKLIASATESVELMYHFEVLPPIWKLFSTPTWRRYVKLLDFITETCFKYIDETMKIAVSEDTPEHELSVLQRLAKHDKKIAVTMALDMLGAGIDTTGKSLAAALYFLAKNPEKQELLRKEALQNLPEKDTPITKEILGNSPYLKAVVKETTRKAPVAIGNLRATVKDLVLGGYRIPKDTELFSMNFLSSNSEEFKDPEKFIPERWLRNTDDDYSYKNAHSFSYLPFGYGTRSCIGKRFANLEMEIALTKIVRNFKLSWPHDDMVFSSKFLYGVAGPVKLKIQQLNE